MNLTIDRIILHNFKGLSHENLLFNHSNVIVSGANGTGKSSVMAAWYWLMSDCSENLVSNPAVFPLNAEEVNPSVEVIVSIDGRVVSLERRIKRTIKKSKVENQADSVSFSSAYLVNSVEYGLRDFKQKLAEYGITDRFLTLSHPDMFLSQKKDEMRKVLFGMVSDVTDLQIAQQMDGVAEATELLKNYTFEEAQSIQNASLRKIREIYGKDGEIWRAKISGLEEAKTDIDFAEIELEKNLVTEKLEKNADAQRVGNLIKDEISKLCEQEMKLSIDLSGIKQKEELERKNFESKILEDRKSKEQKLKELNLSIARWEDNLTLYDDSFARAENEIKKNQDELKAIKKLAFNEKSCVCPTCNRLYESDKIEEMRANHIRNKEYMTEALEKKISENKSLLALKKAERLDLTKKIEQAKKDKAEIEILLNTPVNDFDKHMEKPHSAEQEKIEKALETIQIGIAQKKLSMPDMTALGIERKALETELKEVENKLAKADLNNEIDSKIEALQKEQTEIEQNKANHEKVLYQLSLIQKRKNELLTESINKHFKLVKFSLFEYQKNGNYVECCKAFVGDRELGAALNNAMQIRAKIDVCDGLQNFYGEHYPIWIDNSEALDTDNQASIEANTQVIMLRVTDNKNLFVKEI